MSFPWLERTPLAHHGDRRAQVAAAELASRAAILYRLGFSDAAAAKRLAAAVAWEYDPAGGPHTRPRSLDDAAIAKIVADTYARRPG